MHTGRRAGRLALGAAAIGAVTCLVAACGTSPTTTSSKPASGGTLTVLLGAAVQGEWDGGLDPADSSTFAAAINQENAIYGELFEVGSKSQLIYDLATGYRLSNDNKTLTVTLRKGVKFSDGTPFDAAAVAWNWRRDLSPKIDTDNLPTNWAASSITTPNNYTVVLHLTAPDGAIVDQFQGTPLNSIASPTAYKKEGAVTFAKLPVGAGPFEVVSDVYDAKMVLKRNPLYWQKGLPYLNKLIFETTATDETGLEALGSGAAQAYMQMGTPALVKAYKAAGFHLTTIEETNPGFVQVNTSKPPFNNILAREAIYYATNVTELNQALYGRYGVAFPPTESFTTAAGLFYDPKVPGYRTYDLAKAKALVKELGGLSFQLMTYAPGEPVAQGGYPISSDLASMYKAAGMKVTYFTLTDLGTYVEKLASGNWQAGETGDGSWDPAMETGVTFRFECHYIFSGVCSTKLDKLMTEAEASARYAQRQADYDQVASLINQEAYGAFLFPTPVWDVTAKGVTGPGLTSPLPDVALGADALWQYAAVKS